MRRQLGLRVLAGILSAGLLGGCRVLNPPNKAANGGKPPEPPKTATLPKDLTTRGVVLHWREKLPTGGSRRKMDLQAESGTMSLDSQSGTLKITRGTIYQNDKPLATFTAPTVEAYRNENRVVGYGGVVVHSISPPGTTLQADQMTWRIDEDEVVAVGNVRYTEQPPGTKEPNVRLGPLAQVTGDTAMKRLRIP